MVDATSDEVITYVFRPIDGTLSRIVGHQSMPLLSGLPADGVRLSRYTVTKWAEPELPA